MRFKALRGSCPGSKRVLSLEGKPSWIWTRFKALRGSPKGKAQRGQYLLAVKGKAQRGQYLLAVKGKAQRGQEDNIC